MYLSQLSNCIPKTANFDVYAINCAALAWGQNQSGSQESSSALAVFPLAPRPEKPALSLTERPSEGLPGGPAMPACWTRPGTISSSSWQPIRHTSRRPVYRAPVLPVNLGKVPHHILVCIYVGILYIMYCIDVSFRKYVLCFQVDNFYHT